MNYSPLIADSYTVAGAIAYLQKHGYKVNAPKVKKPTNGLQPWNNTELKGYKSAWKDAPTARIKYTFEDGIVINGYILFINKSWQTRSSFQAACDRYRYRKQWSEATETSIVYDKGTAWETIGKVKNYNNPSIDAIPVPALVDITCETVAFDVEDFNLNSIDYRVSSENRCYFKKERPNISDHF